MKQTCVHTGVDLRIRRTNLRSICNSRINRISSRIKRSPVQSDKPFFFRVCWWNGGGNIKLRLSTNPELIKFLENKPDIFVYGETCTSSPLGLSINGYACFLHNANLNVAGSYRRGLAIFFKKKYRFLLTKVYSSKIYDIVWIRFSSLNGFLYFCFFYSPGSHHPISVRTKFYKIFSSNYSRFASLGKVYLLGDTNARLGRLLNDRNVRGELIINSNQPLFLDFLQYSGLVILNSKFCYGTPTYEIVGKKRSIIDLGLTNSIETVENFEIESTPFGVNSQTCHRARTITINTSLPPRTPVKAPRRVKGLNLTFDDHRNLGKLISEKIFTYEFINSSDYFLLVETFNHVKKKLLTERRYTRHGPPTSPTLRLLQRKFSEAIASMQKEKNSVFL